MQFFGRPPPQQSPSPAPQIVLYTRTNCHLCDAAKELLERYQPQHGFLLDEINVDTDPALVRLYGECVPVVTVDGAVRFRGAVNEVLLRRLLRAGRTGA